MEDNFIQPLLTDFYQIMMAYAYWKSKKLTDMSVFDLYFRKNPFKGEYTIFAGLESCINLIKNFKYTVLDIDFIRSILPANVDQEFFTYLQNLTADDVIMTSVPEGTVVFPNVPLVIIEGPLIVCQLLETALLNLVNYASLVATNAARFRQAAGEHRQLLEFGLRRAQGPDGGVCASRNCYLGGFNGTSNVLAGKIYNIPIKGTQAHSFVTSYRNLCEITDIMIERKSDKVKVDFISICKRWHVKVADFLGVLPDQIHEGEFTAFIAYAQAFPTDFLVLVDTYNVVRSGIPNFVIVSLALNECGYRTIGVRIDSGDLAYLSQVIRDTFKRVATNFNVDWFESLTIVASNDINEDTLHSLNQQGHSIDSFGIGTHLVTCQKQPALGCVYKLVEVNGQATIKLSEDIHKMTIPGKKAIYRLYGKDGLALMDHMTKVHEPSPEPNKRLLCRHPSNPAKRAYVIPSSIGVIHQVYWSNGKQSTVHPDLSVMRAHTIASLATIRCDHKRALNPTPYKVSLSSELYDFSQNLWLQSAPIGELF